MKTITIIESDDEARTAYVQINESDDIGSGKEGTNARHEFVLEPEGDADERPLWKGSIIASLVAAYPKGAIVHSVEAMNTLIDTTLVSKGLRVKLEDGTLVTPEEKVRLDDLAAEALANAPKEPAAVAAQEIAK